MSIKIARFVQSNNHEIQIFYLFWDSNLAVLSLVKKLNDNGKKASLETKAKQFTILDDVYMDTKDATVSFVWNDKYPLYLLITLYIHKILRTGNQIKQYTLSCQSIFQDQ